MGHKEEIEMRRGVPSSLLFTLLLEFSLQSSGQDEACVFNASSTCQYTGTDILCDPCESVECSPQEFCHVNYTTCAYSCEYEYYNGDNGTCTLSMDSKETAVSWNNNTCQYAGTNITCDPCDNVECGLEEACRVNYQNCTYTCECKDDFHHRVNGSCISLCEPNPCNGNGCVLDPTSPTKYRCNCTSDYEGANCELVHDYCMDDSPRGCPRGSFDCEMNAPGNYTCECAPGHSLNTTSNSCVRVGQRMNATIVFRDSYYSEEYNDMRSELYANTTTTIKAAMLDLYTFRLIDIQFENFTQGSLVSHVRLALALPSTGDLEENLNDLKMYLVSCDTGVDKRKCFGQLGRPFLPIDGLNTTDERCSDVFCPEWTKCSAQSNSTDDVTCVCHMGFTVIDTVVDVSGRHIERCLDIDECTSWPCQNETMCVNSPGSYECLPSPCSSSPCPGNAECTPIDHEFFQCQCSWIYLASDCQTVWPLIWLILAVVLLTLLVLSWVTVFLLFRRSRSSSYHLFSAKSQGFENSPVQMSSPAMKGAGAIREPRRSTTRITSFFTNPP